MLISKPLFKQSAKANFIPWLLITIASSVMIFVIILVVGKLNFSQIRNSLTGMFASAAEQTTLKMNALNAYNSTLPTVENVVGLYDTLGSKEATISTLKTQMGTGFSDKFEAFAIDIIDRHVSKPELSNIDLTTQIISEQIKNAILSQPDAELKNAIIAGSLSASAIGQYNALINFGAKAEEAFATTIANINDTIPEDVAASLHDLGEMDVYQLMIGSMFYKMAGILLPIVFIIVVCNSLLAGQIDNGSMAFVLSTPIKRKKVVFTQMSYVLGALFSMFAFITLGGMLGLTLVGTKNITIGYGELALLNLSGLITCFAISGICFLASAWFNRSKNSIGVGGGLSMFFVVCTILGFFGSKAVPKLMQIQQMNVFNYLSLITLFDIDSIFAGTLAFVWKLAVLLVVGIICYLIAIWKFEKKDLPL